MLSRGNSALRRATALLLAALVAASGLAGCLGRDDGGSGFRAESPERVAGATASEKGWQVGNWWAYRATFEENQSIDIALVVFEATDDHFLLGSNLSAGFFGLPFNGNVTRPNLNPVIAGEEWRLYDFPLSAGKSWAYELFGYTLHAQVSEARVAAPRVGEHAGFELTASSFGRTVVSYTYSPKVEWFTRLVLVEPTDGHEVVRVELLDYGERYGADYYVNVPVRTVHATYPSAPERERVSVEGSYLRLFGTVSLSAKIGRLSFELRDPNGRVVMDGVVAPSGAHLDRRELDPAPGAWALDALGLGQGALHFEMTALKPARDGRVIAPAEARSLTDDAAPPTFDLGAWLARGAPTPAREAREAPLPLGLLDR